MSRYAVPAKLARQIEEARVELVDALATLGDLGGTLDGLLGDLRAQHSEATERWQESERGQAVDSWLSEVEALAEQMQGLADDGASLMDDLAAFPTEPTD